MIARILVGHVIDGLRSLPEGSMQCAVTSPPYWGLRDYKIKPQVWGGDPICEHEWGVLGRPHHPGQVEQTKWKTADAAGAGGVAGSGSFCQFCGAWLGCFGLEPTPTLYIEHAVEIFREVRRVLAKDGTLWLNIGDSYATGAGRVGNCPGGGVQGAMWAGDIDRLHDEKRGYRGARLPNGRGDAPLIEKLKTRAERDGSHAGKHTAMTGTGPMTQPNRMPIDGCKPKDLVGIPWMLAFALRADGWYLRQDIIWAKPNPMPESVRDRCTKAHEYLFLLSKSERYYYDQEAILEPCSPGTNARFSQDVQNQIGSERAHAGGKTNGNMKAVGRMPSEYHGSIPGRKDGPGQDRRSDGDRGRKLAESGGGTKNIESFDAAMAIMPEKRNKRSVWEIATQPYSEAHFATYPEALVEPCILAGSKPGDAVLDPFAGSGTTGAVALRYARNFVGCELNPDYAQLGQKRINSEAPLLHKVTVEVLP